ncbi:MAG: TonB-dependent receptor plug domain-containing protein, partial [Muribaculaceae bacterium]|nr:TonB-dependent receptor plug domain-containing protein [Muribaculaceae bacterium]
VRILNHYNGGNDPALNARTQLLLQSELRGRIEDPSYYFDVNNRDADRNLDLLMMVNGWSRYNLPEAIMGKYAEPSIPLEIGQEISGRVKSRWRGKPLEGVMVYAIAPRVNFGTYAETDANGEFHLDGFDFPAGSPFIFRAMNENGGNEGNYELSETKYPASDILLGKSSGKDTEAEISDFFKGSPWIMLDEIKVQAFADEEVDIYEMLASHSKTTEDFEKRGITTLEEAVRGIGGTIIRNGRLYWRGKPVTYYIDGVRHESPITEKPFSVKRVSPKKQAFWNGGGQEPRVMPESSSGVPVGGIPLSDIDRLLPFDAIERIDFLRSGEALILGNSMPGGALMITTKSGGPGGIKTQFELKDYVPLGYQKYKEYASPLLSSSADAYDLQNASTLLWLPSVRFDGDGKDIELKLPLSPEYDIIIEGISDEGPLYERK